MPGTGDIIWIVDRYSSIMAGRSEVPAPRILTNSTYYLQKDVVLDSWVSQIQSVFQRWKKSRHLTELLNKFFISAENPYYSALYLFVYSGDLKLAKTNTLAFTAMQDFQAWLRFSNQPSVSSQLNPELKMKAFTHVTGQRNIAVMKLVFEVFKMKESKELFVKDIHEMLDRKMYKEAAQITAMLDLQDFFTIEDFLVPLIFLDVVNVVEEYLDASSDTIRSNLIQFLDCMMTNGSPESERNLIIERLNIPVSDVKFQKIQYKPLKKFMDKTIKKYNIDPSCCPNLVERKDRGALNFILKKRYHDNDIGHDGWREMVEDTVRSREGQMDLIRALTDMQDMKEALYWAQFYEIPFEEYPFYLQNYSKSKDLGEITDEDDNRLEIVRENKMQHYNMPLPKESIIMIDTIEKLETFIDCELNGSAKTIGLDAEWKPAFTKSVAVLSLMQIATIDRVFLIDMLILDKNSCVWENFGNQLFANQNILKLGFSFDGDIHMLRQSIRTFEKYKLSGLGFLDISLLWKTLSKDWSIKLPFEDVLAPKKTDASLSYLVQLCNGFPLDKKEQVSNWEKRPLRESQERYAATDAYCLIMIYNTLKECSLKQNIPFFDICEELMTKVTTKKPPIKKKHHQAKQQQSTELNEIHQQAGMNEIQQRLEKIQIQNKAGINEIQKYAESIGIPQTAGKNEIQKHTGSNGLPQTAGKNETQIHAGLNEIQHNAVKNTEIKIYNYPLRPNENLLEIIKKICIALKHPISNEQIRECYRTQSPRKKPPYLIVNFASRTVIEELLGTKKAEFVFSTVQMGIPANVPILIMERMSRKSERTVIFYALKEMKREKGFKRVWMDGGVTLVRRAKRGKVIVLRDFTDFLQLEELV